MNKSFKVVFNKARGALMVVNEVTSCVQAKGTKTVIAAAVAALAAGGVAAAESEWVDAPKDLVSVEADQVWEDVKDQNRFDWAPVAEKETPGTFLSTSEKKTFDKTLWVSGNNKYAQATGLAVTGAGGKLTNAGTIYVTSGKDGVSYQNKGILANNGATAVNQGVIVAKNAYGMTVGTTGTKSNIVNNGKIYVEETGAGMELGGGSGSTAVNVGLISVGTPTEEGDGGKDRFGHGVLINTEGNTFTNEGTIDVADVEMKEEGKLSAIEIKDKANNTTVNLEAGSAVNGEVHIASGITGTVLNANGFKGELALNNDAVDTDDAKALTLNVKDGADLELKDGYGSVISEAVIENGKLTASIWQSYKDAEGKDASDNIFKKVVVQEDGIFNVKELNSSSEEEKPHDTLLVKNSHWVLSGGDLQVAGKTFTGKLKVGTASDTTSFTFDSGDYSYESLTVAKRGTVAVSAGSVTVGDLTLSDGKKNNSAFVFVDEAGSLTVNGTLSAEGDYTDDMGVYVVGDLTLGSDAKLALAENALKIDGELNAAQNKIFKTTETENEDGTKTTTYALAEGVDKIVFTEGAGLLLSDNVSMTQKDFTDFLGKLKGTWGEGATVPEIVFTNVAFQGDVTFDTALGYNAYATEVGAGTDAFNKETATTTVSASKDVAVGALKVDAGTKTVAIEDQVTGEDGTKFVFAGLGGNIITGVNKVETITANGEVTLGWDETSKGVVNADWLKADSLSVAGQFEATNVEVTNGAIDNFGSLTVEKLVQTAEKTGDFTVGQAATLDVRRIEIETNLEQGATLVIGDRLATTTENIATLADEQLDAQIAEKVSVQEADSIATTNANGRNLLMAAAGEQYKADTNVGLYVDNTIAVDGTNGKLLVGTNAADTAGAVSLGDNAVMVIDASKFSADKAVFDATLSVNATTSVILTGADRIGSVKLFEGTKGFGGETDSEKNFTDALQANDKNAWLSYGVTTTEGENGGTFIDVAFDKDGLEATGVNARSMSFAEKVLTNGSESLGVVNAIGTTFVDDQGNLTETGEEALDEYMALPAVAGTYNAAYDAAEQVWNTIGAHNIDRTAGKTNGVWADVFYSANEAGDVYGNGYGYEADVYGGVLGYDYTAACGGKIGAALTIGTSDVDAKGDFIGDYGNDADFWGLSIYASKDITEKMIVSADITYLSLDNDIKGSVAGASVAESIDSSVISVGLRADWKAYESNAFEIVPHAGIRYAQIDVDDYREMDGESLDVLEMPIGVAFNGKFEAAGMKFVPTLDFTVVPQIGDTEVHPLNGDTLDVLNNTYNTTLGISAEYGDFTFGVAAKYGFGTDDRSNAGVKVNATYAF